MSLTLLFWAVFFGRLALLGACLVVLASLAARTSWSAVWSRSVWRACSACLFAVLVLETTGAGSMAIRWTMSLRPSPPPLRGLIPWNSNTQVSEATTAVAVQEAPSTDVAIPTVWWPGILWIGVSAWLFARISMARASFWRRRRLFLGVNEPALLQRVGGLARRFGIPAPRLLQSEALLSPVAFGTLRPCIALPRSFSDDFSSAQQEAVLAHELAHLAARDAAWQWFADCLCALWWWHPMAWWSRRRLALANECAADEASLLLPDGAATLAESLLTMGRRLLEPPAGHSLGMAGSGLKSSLARRVERLLDLSQRPLPQASRLGTRWGRMAVWAGFGLLGFAGSSWTSGAGGATASPRSLWEHSLAARTFAALQASDTAAESKRPAATRSHPDAPAASTPERPAKTPNALDDRRQALSAKLDRIQLRDLALDGLTLDEAVLAIANGSREQDPEGAGINIMFLGGGTQLGGKRLRSTPPLHQASVRTALDALVRLSPVEMDYRVESRWVLVRRLSVDLDPLHTRTFRMETNLLVQGLRRMSRGSDSFFPPADSEEFHSGRFIRDFFREAGIDLEPPKQMFYSLGSGLLMLRASLTDLEAVEALLSRVLDSPQQLRIDATLLELTDEDALAMNLDKILGFAPGADTMAGVVEPTSREQFSKGFLSGGAQFESGSRIPRAESTTILNAERFQEVMRSLQTRPGAKLLSSPKLITLSGRLGQIKTVEVRNVVVDLDRSEPGEPRPLTEKVELGPTLDILPQITGDGSTIQMRVTPAVREFLGYDEERTRAVDPRRRVAAPMFRVWQAVASSAVPNGQTLAVVAGAVEESPGAAGVAKTSARKVRKTRFLFVTPTLIDDAGQPLKTGEPR
ncbi:MAG: hypothetical protein HY299_22990 [Verrucomicrobia bacterium]|nr:hypothetical protein [Verrucomicrobiota bacterium]